jgi:hypothetical protein
VWRLETGQALALVSQHTTGRRLSDLFPKARGPVFALELIRQVTPALAILHQQGVAHGALTAERIVVTRSGLVVVEHVIGPAIEALRLSAIRLQTELGLAIPNPGEPIGLDRRTDIIQLGVVALSLLLGRRLDPRDFPTKTASLLDELAGADPNGSSASSHLRRWLERALQLGPRPFGSALEAQAALNELPGDTDFQPTESHPTILAFHAPAETPAAVIVEPNKPTPTPPPLPIWEPISESKHEKPQVAAGPRRRFGSAQLAAAGLALLCIVLSGVIAGLVYTRPAPVVVAASPSAPAATEARTGPRATALPMPAASPESKTEVPAPPPPDPGPAEKPTPASPRVGGLKLTAPIDIQVFEGGTLLGSTAGQIAIVEGAHTLELVNDSLGYRTRQTATVKPGQVTSLAIAVPNGRISINAGPWADVWIDGSAAGQTPIANLALPIGSHEIIFRNPQFSEQRQTVVVKVDGLARASVKFQQ